MAVARIRMMIVKNGYENANNGDDAVRSTATANPRAIQFD